MLTMTTYSLFQYRIQTTPRIKLHLFRPRSLSRIAQMLHYKMYTAFAAGDVTSLDTLCCDGLHSNLRRRIMQRPRGQTLRWEYEQVKRPRVISYRGHVVPKSQTGGQLLGTRQLIVRLVSRQRLTKSKASETKMDAAEGEWKDMVEYVVIQKRLLNGEEGPWMIWGMAEETSLETLQEWQKMLKRAKTSLVHVKPNPS